MSNVPPPPPPPPPPGMPPPPPVGGYGAGPVAPTGQPLASAGIRIGARLIEIVIAIVVGLIIAAIVVGSGGGRTSVGAVPGGRYNFGSTILSLVFSWLIEAGLTAWKGGSLGKLILGLRVVNAGDGSSPVSWGTATVRWAIPGAFSIIPVLGGIAAIIVFIVSLVFLFTDKLRQTVSDKAAKTLVVVK